jgi:hypothetical protein
LELEALYTEAYFRSEQRRVGIEDAERAITERAEDIGAIERFKRSVSADLVEATIQAGNPEAHLTPCGYRATLPKVMKTKRSYSNVKQA